MLNLSPEALEARREYRRQYEREYRRKWRQKPENRLKAKEYERRYWERKAQQSRAIPSVTHAAQRSLAVHRFKRTTKDTLPQQARNYESNQIRQSQEEVTQ